MSAFSIEDVDTDDILVRINQIVKILDPRRPGNIPLSMLHDLKSISVDEINRLFRIT